MFKKALIIITILAIPTFALMLRFGVYTMHDFHLFRQFEFDKCIQAKIFPCRWAPDAGLGYGEPLFNFYGQFPYWMGEIVHLSGFSIVNSVKLLFILSLVVSGVAMYGVSRQYWGEWGGILSATLYMYAPYRSVDVWVRGALNESLALVLYPLIFYNFDHYLSDRQNRHLMWLVVFSFMLVTTHNLSVLMFAPFLVAWGVIKIFRQKNTRPLLGLVGGGILTLMLSAYYLLPVIFENHLVTISKTTQGYYDYRAHFATLTQLFLSRFWGYGASLWGPVDDLSFSIGQAQWLIVAVAVMARPKKISFYIFAAFGLLAVFLTHNKSQFIWQIFSPMAYIQFPWRYLAVAIFFLSLAGGAFGSIINKKLFVLLILIIIGTNYSFFRPDIWREVNDAQQFSGQLWDEQRSSALQDFWPANALEQPTTFALPMPQSVEGPGKFSFPMVYFPGWQAQENNRNIPIFPSGKLGLITADLSSGKHKLDFKFTDTWPRTVGNWVSGMGAVLLLLWIIKTLGLRW